MATPPSRPPAEPAPRWRDRAAAGGALLRRRAGRLAESRAAWVGFFLLATTPLVLSPGQTPRLTLPPEGAIAPFDLVAPETREFVDEAATRRARDTRRGMVRPVYDVDARSLSDTVAGVRRTFASWGAFRGRPGASPEGGSDATRRAFGYLASVGFETRAEERFLQALRGLEPGRIVGSLTLLPPEGRITLRDARTGREWDEEAPAQALSLDEARRRVLAALRAAGAGTAEIEGLGPFAQDLLSPSMTSNISLTESRRQAAEDRLDPLLVRVPKGKVLLRRGDVVDEGAVRLVRDYTEAGASPRGRETVVGTVLLVALLSLFMLRYADFYRRTQRREPRLFALMALVTVVALAVDRGFLWLFDHLVDSLRVDPFSGPSVARFMVPLASGGMLIALLVGTRAGLAYTLFYLPLFAALVRFDWPLVLFCLAGNLAAVYGITGYRRRTAPIKAGLVLGSINVVAVLALLALPGLPPPPGLLLRRMAAGFGGGVLVAILVSFLLPLLESAFNILTDVRLLELSNLNNPLLRRLAVEAPGSYNHSVIVGTLAEAAAEAIGANALFCRVAAYYHDVGKLLKPAYFIENQREGDNRHDRLTPHMSAIVIASHVKEGYELARSYGLPQEVLDIIPQHHGTRKINFFYQKALRSGGTEPAEVQEADFRYPGPKPQTREAAIFMLSDSIEAAARTLDDPSPARFKGLIRKIVSDVVLDDQLDQSDLTFADLQRAEAAFLRTLASIYHHRIDYPGFDFEKIPERPFHGSRSHQEPPPTFKRWGR